MRFQALILKGFFVPYYKQNRNKDLRGMHDNLTYSKSTKMGF